MLQKAGSNEAYMELRYQLAERVGVALRRLGTYCEIYVDDYFLIQRPRERVGR